MARTTRMTQTPRTPSRRRRRAVPAALAAMLTLVLVAAGLGGLVVWQNSYELREEAVTIRQGGRVLNGVLALPAQGKGPYPLVVFVHGDGPVDATHDTFYRPMWEAFARSGHASLSWNKPGVGGAPGDWLDQSMDDRADEAADAITWARRHPDVDGARIGLWGASQAGWVLPKIAARDPGIRFAIAVSPAVNWLRQGRYNLLAELSRDGASDMEVAAALARRETGLELLARGASYEEYVRAVGDPEGMTAARWRFASKNHTADVSADLPALRGTPVLLVLAGHDVNVDIAETEAAYRRLLPGPALQVAHYPDAGHGLLDHAIEKSSLRLTLTALCAPRALFAEGFLADQARFVSRALAAGS
ncbi:alpha/beta hydrolase family protein [Streptomyces sp. NRRL F-4428]|uniref:alpha/beta hydrolase family protein n=1 Tax=Streptomyces sp. NRRL F-4428 TaxID=1609137 RepID=UPI0005ED2133|nr:CocE/NonD family hydrolase [Streptomyces sp. NRRL F-4428]KJK53779.1 hydrolase [Streptomyces sp. NRRL F-4428]